MIFSRQSMIKFDCKHININLDSKVYYSSKEKLTFKIEGCYFSSIYLFLYNWTGDDTDT